MKEKVYNKLLKEYNFFLNGLKIQSIDKVEKSSYEIFIKQEILECVRCLNEEQLKKISNCHITLDFLYRRWLKCEDSLFNEISDLVCYSIDKIKEVRVKDSR